MNFTIRHIDHTNIFVLSDRPDKLKVNTTTSQILKAPECCNEELLTIKREGEEIARGVIRHVQIRDEKPKPYFFQIMLKGDNKEYKESLNANDYWAGDKFTVKGTSLNLTHDIQLWNEMCAP